MNIRLILLLLGVAVSAPVAADGCVLPLNGAADAPYCIDVALMQRLPRQSLDTSDHGTPARFEGVWLRDVLAHAGAPDGKALRGAHLRRILRVSARDGYAVVFALAELDAGFRDKPVLLADHRDGKPLAEHEGPLRLVVADEHRGARSIRQIERMDLIEVPMP